MADSRSVDDVGFDDQALGVLEAMGDATMWVKLYDTGDTPPELREKWRLRLLRLEATHRTLVKLIEHRRRKGKTE